MGITMQKKHKTGLKWVGALGTLAGAVTPLVIALKNDEKQLKVDEKELHSDEEIIAKLYAEILNQANISAESINNIRQILLEVYTKLYGIEAKSSGFDLKIDAIERAINMLIRSNHDHH